MSASDWNSPYSPAVAANVAMPESRVTVEVSGDIASEPSPVSPIDDDRYHAIQRTIREAFPGTVVSPYLVLGATDGRHMTGVSEHVYRFSAMKVGPTDLERIHGINERASIDSQGQVVRFYTRLLQNTAQ